MCGIAGLHIKPSAKGKVPAGRLMDWLLLGIEPRGKDAAGYLSVGFDHSVTMDKEAETASVFIKDRKPIKGHPQTILAHTRAATQGSPSNNANNHPVQYGTVFLVHNGWILNDVELFAETEMEVTAEVDTLAIAAMLWDQCDGAGWANGTEPALSKLEGAVAIAAIDIKQPGEVLLARGNHSPLWYIETGDFFMWASTVQAMRTAWAKVYGTPPALKRFKEFAEGEFKVIKDGEVTFQGEFTPKEFVSRSSWGGWYGSGDYDYSYSGSSISTPTAASKLRGYYVTEKDKDGKEKRYFKEYAYLHANYSTPISRHREYPSTVWSTVLDHERKAVQEYEEFAKRDNEFHDVCIMLAADDLKISYDLAKWLMFNGDPDLVDNTNDQKVINFRLTLERKYTEWYNELVNDGKGEIVDGEVIIEESGIATVKMTDTNLHRGSEDGPPWKISDTSETIADVIQKQQGNVDVKGDLLPTDPGAVIAGLLGSGDDTPPMGIIKCMECQDGEAEADGYCLDCLNFYKQLALDNLPVTL